MTRLRTLLFARRWSALAIVIASLAVRMIVPAGMMPGHAGGGATLIICSGHSMPGMTMPATGETGKSAPAKPDAPCAFTGLLAAAPDSTVLPVLPALPLPITTMLAVIGFGVLLSGVWLRPPSRGPPGRHTA